MNVSLSAPRVSLSGESKRKWDRDEGGVSHFFAHLFPPGGGDKRYICVSLVV